MSQRKQRACGRVIAAFRGHRCELTFSMLAMARAFVRGLANATLAMQPPARRLMTGQYFRETSVASRTSVCARAVWRARAGLRARGGWAPACTSSGSPELFVWNIWSEPSPLGLHFVRIPSTGDMVNGGCWGFQTAAGVGRVLRTRFAVRVSSRENADIATFLCIFFNVCWRDGTFARRRQR